uniref:Uncharacterized protein n=1 Tax=Timema tahoe TaxID=61484 RepID=A0A7R9IEV6_9NEOP|nr:unnamed protein product [Timema tahoe]
MSCTVVTSVHHALYCCHLCSSCPVLLSPLLIMSCTVARVVDVADQETASSMMAAFLGMGLACGSAISLMVVKPSITADNSQVKVLPPNWHSLEQVD